MILAIFSCCTCSHALLRHWEYFKRQQAEQYIVVATEDRHCDIPEGAIDLRIGLDSYIMGEHLPRRMLDTITALLDQPWDTLMLAEYDTLIINPIKIENMKEGVAGHFAGAYQNNYGFYHNPWLFKRGAARRFVEEGWNVIQSGACQEGSMAASPDIFFGLVCYQMEQPVQSKLWSEFSRNSLDREGDLERARLAYRSGVDIIHGIKTEQELEYITKPKMEEELTLC